MKIAIDGPAGSGKSTVAHAVAEQLGFSFLDTGAMYRSVTLACQDREVDLSNDDEVTRVAQSVRVAFQNGEDGQVVLLDGRDVSQLIRTPEVDADVSRVSAVVGVREAMVAEQRRLGSNGDVVAEGRDIGTVVFPDAEVKVFLTADPEARAHRRALQRDIIDPDEEQKILEDLLHRDEADSTRDAAPLKVADDAYRLDTTSLTIDDEVAKIVELVKQAQAKSEAPKRVVEKEQDAPERKESKKKDDKIATGRMRLFEAHEHEEYFEHGVREYPITARILLGAAIYVCGGLSKVFWPWKVEDGEKLWNSKEGRVVVMNHVSMLDPVVIVSSDWAHGRRMRPIYKSEFNKNKLVNWFFARIGGIPVDRGTADIKAVRRAQRALQRGEDVLVFPEGTRIYSDDQEVTIHGGFALMAQLAKAPVLPVAIVGARDGAPGGNKPLRPGRIWMKVGDPVTFDMVQEKGRKKRAKAMEKLAMERVYELREQLRDQHPGKM